MSVAPQGGSTMTVLGKILVFVNLVFSLITGALIIMVFATRTNWKAGFDDLNKKYTVQQATIGAYTKDLEERTKDKEKVEGELKNAQAKFDAEKKALDAKLTAATTLSQQNENRAK